MLNEHGVCPVPHIAAKVNMLIDTDIDPVSVTGSRPLMGHCVYESFVLLPLKLCVKFEWSVVKHCKKYLRKCEITNLVTRVDHAHFVAVQRTKWVRSARVTKN